MHTEADLQLYLSIPCIKQCLNRYIEQPDQFNEICKNLTSIIYGNASNTPRCIRYKDAFQIANQLIRYIEKDQKADMGNQAKQKI
jgi:hypothetical protein